MCFFFFFSLVFVTIFSFLTTCIQLKILALHSADSLHPEWFCFLKATIHYICLSLVDALAIVLFALNTAGKFIWPFKLETTWKLEIQRIQFNSVAHSCPTLCDPMNHSRPGLPVHHQLLESTHTHVHRVGDAIQPSHPLSSPSPALNLSQHQGLFQWISSLHQMAKVLEFSFNISPTNEHPGMISFRMDWLM